MKKVFLSLATIAFVAAGSLTVTSCGDDDSPAPPVVTPPTELTENFIQVNKDQEEITYTIYAVHVNGTGQDAPIKEYTLQDGTVVAAFEFISHNGTSEGSLSSATANTWTTLLTKVNTAVPVDSDERYVLPFTVDNSTLLGGFTSTMNDTSYEYAAAADFKTIALSYTDKTMNYTLAGTDADDTSITLKTNVNGSIGGLYSLDASESKGLKAVSKNVQLTQRKSLN